jgi:hypothetical protein
MWVLPVQLAVAACVEPDVNATDAELVTAGGFFFFFFLAIPAEALPAISVDFDALAPDVRVMTTDFAPAIAGDATMSAAATATIRVASV